MYSCPPLAQVEVVVPPFLPQFAGLHFIPVDAAGIKADGYCSGLFNSPTENHATVWVPAGRYRVPPPDDGMGLPPQPPGATPPPAATAVEIDIRIGAQNRIVLPGPRPPPPTPAPEPPTTTT